MLGLESLRKDLNIMEEFPANGQNMALVKKYFKSLKSTWTQASKELEQALIERNKKVK